MSAADPGKWCRDPTHERRVRAGGVGYCFTCVRLMRYGPDGYRTKERAFKRAAIRSFKLEAGCAQCGYRRSADALHFHHLDPAEKDCKVSELIRRGWDRTWAEIAKCEVICANCHAELHEAERSDLSDPA